MAEVIINMKHIEKRYNNVPVLTVQNLEIEKGDFLAVIGSSGCGKTTLLKMIKGLIQPDTGKVAVNGTDIP